MQWPQAEATVHACLRAGIRHYDSAPLYSESEDKLGAALLSASEDTIGAPCSFANGQLVVDSHHADQDICDRRAE